MKTFGTEKELLHHILKYMVIYFLISYLGNTKI